MGRQSGSSDLEAGFIRDPALAGLTYRIRRSAIDVIRTLRSNQSISRFPSRIMEEIVSYIHAPPVYLLDIIDFLASGGALNSR